MEGPVIVEKGLPKKRRSRKLSNRIIISEEARGRVERWSLQIESEFPGFQISKADLVSWIICNRALELSNQEMSVIRDEFFDRARCIRLALKELTLAQKQGGEDKTAELIKRYAFLFEGGTKKRQKKLLQKDVNSTENSLKNNESDNIKAIEKHKE